MKLYHIEDAPAGERWQPLKPKNGVAVNIGGTGRGREELADFLNRLEIDLLHKPLTRDEIVYSNTPEAQAAAKAAMAPTPDSAAYRSADGIVAFILEEAPVAVVENILAALGTRVAELAKGAR